MTSRILLVPFSLPTTGPTTPDEMNAYDEFQQSQLNHSFSSAVGWVVYQRQIFLESGKEYVLDTQAELRDAFGMKVRNITGWASCLFILKQVNFRIGVVHSNKGVSFCIE